MSPKAKSHQRLTNRILEQLQPGEVVRDSLVRGMLAERGRSTVVSLKIATDLRQGTRNGAARKPIPIHMTMGRFPEMTLEAARTEAMRLLSEIRAGRDPRPVAPVKQPAAKSNVWTVQEMLDEYEKDLATREKAKRTIKDHKQNSGYLSDWLALPITEVTRQMARARHEHISTTNGKYAANHALKTFRTSFNFAKKVHDEELGENPVDAVTFNPERGNKKPIPREDLAGWYKRLQTIPNPLRRLMHEIGLFSGLRPGNLAGLMKGWLLLDQRAILIPAQFMKARREFSLPLSKHLVGLLQRALVLSNELSSDSPWVFPTWSRDGSEVIATQVWKEDKLASETGHILRHTYSNLAKLLGVQGEDRELLLAHQIPGVQGTYLHTPTLFSRLLTEQEKVTAYILEVTGQKKPEKKSKAPRKRGK